MRQDGGRLWTHVHDMLNVRLMLTWASGLMPLHARHLHRQPRPSRPGGLAARLCMRHKCRRNCVQRCANVANARLGEGESYFCQKNLHSANIIEQMV